MAVGHSGPTALHLPLSAGLYGLPKRTGKLKDLSKFDASFFGVHPKQAHTMDPQLRLLLEVTYEAILDGGGSSGGHWPTVATSGPGAGLCSPHSPRRHDSIALSRF